MKTKLFKCTKYFRVITQYQAKIGRTVRTFAKGQLFTRSEIERIFRSDIDAIDCLTYNFDVLEIPRKCTYKKSSGERFASIFPMPVGV